jgi:hypothetical protein
MAKVITNGKPGTTWTNTTGKVQYQLLVSWHNSCGLCCQWDRAIGPLWPTPFHRGCRCTQKAIWPGKESDPFVDFMEKVQQLDRPQQTRVIGRSNLVLVEAGIVQWGDVVTSARVRSLREVVSRQGLTVKQMTDAGVMKRWAEQAYEAVHTPAQAIADAAKKEAIQHLQHLGVGKQEIKQRFGAAIAGRIKIAEGPTGPQVTGPPKPPPPAPPPVPPKPPAPPPVPLPSAAAATPRLTGDEIQALFGIKLKPAAKAKAPTAFPATPDAVDLVKKLGGSTGAELVRDPLTKKLYVRKRGANPDHLREEANADAAYRALGFDVPEFKLYDTPSGPVKLAVFHDGVTLSELMKTDPAAADKAMAKLRKGFVLDALMGNWDVIGMGMDNILVTKAAKVFRIDNGGSLRFRAQGARKGASQWTGTVSELDSLRNSGVNPSAAKVFGSVTDEEIKKQIKALLKKKDVLIASLPADLQGTVKDRLAYLEKIASQKTPNAAKPTVNPAVVKRFGMDTAQMEAWGKSHYSSWATSLSSKETKAVGEYTASGYAWMNDTLRKGTTAYFAPPDAAQKIKALEAALRKAKLDEPIEVTRGVGDLRTAGIDPKTLKPGDIYVDKGFMSTSLKDKPPLGGGAHLVIRLPKGAPGAYVNASPVSSHPSEREFLLPPSTKLKVLEIKKVNGVDTVFMEYFDGP